MSTHRKSPTIDDRAAEAADAHFREQWPAFAPDWTPDEGTGVEERAPKAAPARGSRATVSPGPCTDIRT